MTKFEAIGVANGYFWLSVLGLKLLHFDALLLAIGLMVIPDVISKVPNIWLMILAYVPIATFSTLLLRRKLNNRE